MRQTASESGSQDFTISQDAQGEDFNVFSSLALPHDEHGSALSCLKCTTFYDAFIKLNPNQVVELERNTRKQSIEPLWHDACKLSITASTASKVPQRETTDPAKFLNEHLYPEFQGSVATRYGKESKGLAKEQIRERGCIVMDRGLVVCAGYLWLAASPDGIIDNKLLEIKYPITLRACTSLNDALTSTNQDIRVECGQYVVNPKGPRGYYRQLQLGMHGLGLKTSCLVIWTPVQHMQTHATKICGWICSGKTAVEWPLHENGLKISSIVVIWNQSNKKKDVFFLRKHCLFQAFLSFLY